MATTKKSKARNHADAAFRPIRPGRGLSPDKSTRSRATKQALSHPTAGAIGRKGAKRGKATAPEAISAAAGNVATRRNKSEDLVALLKRPMGASVTELMDASGWQAHSVRGFLSGTVKKRMGLPVGNAKDSKGVRRYRIGA